MDVVSSRAEALRAGLVAAAAAVAVATLSPPGGDSAAHLYRTMLVEKGVHVWDNLWYGGQYPLASYSLLYYLPAAVVGNVPLVVGAVVVSSVLFASIAVHEWGDAARWPARLFAVLAAGPLFTGTYSYAVALAFALGTLRLLQVGRPVLAVASAALALGFSPLAFAFLCVALAAVAAARRRVDRRILVVGGSLTLVAALQLLALALFPSEGRYPFSPVSLAGVLTVSVLGGALASRAERSGAIAPFFVLWALVNLAAFAVPSPFGDNLARLRALVLPVVLLAAVLAGFRPRLLAAAALAAAAVYNLGPDVRAIPKRVDDARTAEQAFWAPALSYVRDRGGPAYRVEVVPTFGHWEAYWVPRAGLPLARGWYRQLDIAENPELYRVPLSPSAYRRWLRRMGVRFVLLPDARLGPLGADREAKLLRSGDAGHSLVRRTPDWQIYEVPDATPIISGPGAARLHRFDHDRIAGSISSAGIYRLRVRYTPYLHVAAGRVCLERARDGMTRLVVRAPGRFVLTVREQPGPILRAALAAEGLC